MTGKDTQQNKESTATVQQDMNSQAQQNAARGYTGPTIKDRNGNDIPFYAAPRSHASDSMTRLAQRAQQHARDIESGKMADPGIPESATPEAKLAARHVPMPAGGLAALADTLWPDDRDNQEAMDQHIFDLMHLNNDTLRNDTTYTVGQSVRIPA